MSEAPLERAGTTSAMRMVATLAGLAAVAGGLMGGTYLLTVAPIRENQVRQVMTRLNELLPAGRFNNEPWTDRARLPVNGAGNALQPAWRARQAGVPVAVVMSTVAPDGYVGPIELLVGLDADGSVRGVRAARHAETPGIGDFIDLRRTGWMHQFDGQSLARTPPERWLPRADGGDFDVVAGATVTSRAVIRGVGQAVDYASDHPREIWAPAAGDTPAPGSPREKPL
jgi:Na+-translocating ferredoxin:NAD+ oxidoreductase subunit G